MSFPGSNERPRTNRGFSRQTGRRERTFGGPGKYPGYGDKPYSWKVGSPPPGTPTEEDRRSGRVLEVQTGAPGDSHLEAFGLVNDENGNAAILWIRYREGGEYEYYPQGDPDRLRDIYLAMHSHSDPGELVWAYLIREHFPYREL